MPASLRQLASKPVWSIVYAGASVLAVFGVAVGISGLWGLVVLLALIVLAVLAREWFIHEDAQKKSQTESEAEGLLATAERERRQFMRALARVTDHSHALYSEEIDEAWYIMDDRRDKMSFRYRTTVDPGSTLIWRRIEMRSPATAPDDNTMCLVARCGNLKLDALRVIEEENYLAYVVFFPGPIRGEVDPQPVEWGVDFYWPGFWDPLRRDGEDSLSLEPSPLTSRFTIRVVFPHGGDYHQDRFLQRTPDVGEEKLDERAGEGPSLVWTVADPEKRRHTAYLRTGQKR